MLLVNYCVDLQVVAVFLISVEFELLVMHGDHKILVMQLWAVIKNITSFNTRNPLSKLFFVHIVTVWCINILYPHQMSFFLFLFGFGGGVALKFSMCKQVWSKYKPIFSNKCWETLWTSHYAKVKYYMYMCPDNTFPANGSTAWVFVQFLSEWLLGVINLLLSDILAFEVI